MISRHVWFAALAVGLISSGTSAAAPRVEDERHTMHADFAGGRVDIAAVDARLSMRTTGFGRDGAVSPVDERAAERDSEKTIYRRGRGLVEWYASAPNGVEQGFTLDARPSGDAPIVLALDFDSELSATKSATESRIDLVRKDGSRALSYGELHTIDATGRELASVMSLDGAHVKLVVDDRDAVYPIVVDPLVWGETQKLTAADLPAMNHMYQTVAVSGDTAVALGEDTNTATRIVAHVFVRGTNGKWTRQTTLAPTDGVINNLNYGIPNGLAIDGDTIALGAPSSNGTNNGTGTVFVYTRSGTTWTQQQKISPSDGGTSGDNFGQAVGLSGDTLVVGAPKTGTVINGGVYVYLRTGTTWAAQGTKIAAADATAKVVGYYVAVSGDTLAFSGAPTSTGFLNHVYVSTRASGVWSPQANLVSKMTGPSASRGRLALSGDTILLGCPDCSGDGTATAGNGEVYVYTRTGTTWSSPVTLAASDGTAGDHFGTAVALSGNIALVGAPDHESAAGGAYLFTRVGTTWTQSPELQASDKTASNTFGLGVAVGPTNAFIGGVYSTDTQYAFRLAAAKGDTCTTATDCLGLICVDGRCCDTACGGGATDDCQACSVAAGAAVDGTCGRASKTTTCRAAVGECDVAETCDGVGLTCPANTFVANGQICTGGACQGGACVLAMPATPDSGASSSSGTPAGGDDAGAPASGGDAADDGCVASPSSRSSFGSLAGIAIALLLVVGARRRILR